MSPADLDRIAASLIGTPVPDERTQARLEGLGDFLAVQILRGVFTTADLAIVARRWIALRGVTL